MSPALFGSAQVADEENPRWIEKCSAKCRNACNLCPHGPADRLFPMRKMGSLAMQWHTGSKLCTSDCHIVDQLRGVTVADFNAEKDTIRFLVLWRPWLKKYKVQTPESQGRSHARWSKTCGQKWQWRSTLEVPVVREPFKAVALVNPWHPATWTSRARTMRCVTSVTRVESPVDWQMGRRGVLLDQWNSTPYPLWAELLSNWKRTPSRCWCIRIDVLSQRSG